MTDKKRSLQSDMGDVGIDNAFPGKSVFCTLSGSAARFVHLSVSPN